MSKREKATEIKLVINNGDKITTTSLLVAEKFGKRHDHVLEKIRNLKCSANFHAAHFREISPKNGGMSYKDSYGREQKYYEMTEEGFMFIAMRFTGKEAVKWQETFIAAFQEMRKEIDRIFRQQSEPAWKLTRDDSKLGYKWMSANLKEKRELDGKATSKVHYMTEAKLINGVLTGNFSSVDRETLSKSDLDKIVELQRCNANLIVQNVDYKTRKQVLQAMLTKQLASTSADVK